MNDQARGYDYPEKVEFEINKDQPGDYQAAAQFLGTDRPDVICLQHEFGLFGGAAGEYILDLLANVDIPVVTTLHTVLAEPNDDYRRVTLELARRSDRLIVMSQKAIDILQSVYGVNPEKIRLIPHGIPDYPLVDPATQKPRFQMQGRQVLLTFGLLSRNKNIEAVLEALPPVVDRFPDVVYVVLGATHPHLITQEGDAYRDELKRWVQRLGLQDHVVFHDTFVSQQELCDYLAASDIFITPYGNRDQVVSGTLSYALGMGVPVVSTPYWYAEEALADGRGCLVPFNQSQVMGEAFIDLLGDADKRQRIRRRAYDYSRQWVWETVAGKYLVEFLSVKQAQGSRRQGNQAAVVGSVQAVPDIGAPGLDLSHLVALSDDTGLWQHAQRTVPDRIHGYCTDDNARALVVVAEAVRNGEQLALSQRLCDSYLGFLRQAFNTETGRFRNFMSDQGRWLDSAGSEDSQGRALWGLGEAVFQLQGNRRAPLAVTLFRQSMLAAETFFYPRSIAFALIGLHAYLTVFDSDTTARRMLRLLADRLHLQFDNHATADWPWFEDTLSYDNAKLPHALLLGGFWLGSETMSQAGLRALEWLVGVQSEDGHQAPIGNQGWYPRGGEKARFDQQPIDAHATVHACYTAYTLTGKRIWLHRMMSAFNWFLGNNLLNEPVYDAASGGCHDGLNRDRLNHNQGAESTLAWLMSRALVQRVPVEEAAITMPFAAQASEQTAGR